MDFEKELRVIYGRARSIDDVTADLQHLRDTMESRRRAFDQVQERASGLIETRLDDAVRQVLASYQSSLPSELEGLDRDVDLLTQSYFDGAGISYVREQQSGRVAYQVQPSAALPEGYREGFVAGVGDSRNIGEGEALHVGHAVVQAAVEAARRATNAPFHVVFEAGAKTPEDVRALAGRRGRLVVTRASYRGIERVDNLLVTAVLDGENDPLPTPAVGVLLASPVREVGPSLDLQEGQALHDAIDTALLIDQAAVSDQDQARFDQMLRQLDYYLADQVLIIRRKEAGLNAQIEELEKRLSRYARCSGGRRHERTAQVVAQGAWSCRAADRGPPRGRRRRVSPVAGTPGRAPLQQARHHACAGRPVRNCGHPVLKFLHTADLHLGLESAQFEPDARRRLARARLDVANTILSVAEQYAVDAVLWAGDIFDTPEPSEDWWRGFAKVLKSRAGWSRPIVLLPGNHDPVKAGSVFHPDHAFRKLLPDWVHVVDSERFELALTPDAVLFAAPCTSMAGAEDLALTLPCRPEGDARIRVGLVHGSTFDMEGYQTSFPIARDAPAQRGLDYLAVGDTHGFRVITESGVAPIVYPGAPEQTRFGESGAGQVAAGHAATIWSAADRHIRQGRAMDLARRVGDEPRIVAKPGRRGSLDDRPASAAGHDGIGTGRKGSGPADAASEGRRRHFGPRRRVCSGSERAPCRSRGCQRLDEGRARNAVDRRGKARRGRGG